MKYQTSIVLLLIASLWGCEKTSECKQLEGIIETNERILQRATRRVTQGERIEERLARAKTKANEVLATLALDKTEAEVNTMLDERAKKLGATIVRGVREIDPVSSQGQQIQETQWLLTFPAKSIVEAKTTTYALLAIPPFVRFIGLNPPEGKQKNWRLEVSRGIVDRAPMDIKPTPLPRREDASRVKSEFGFCGAGGLRERLVDIEKEISAIEEAAGQMTVNLPMAASWEGLWRRAEVIRDIELESRRMIAGLVDAVAKTKSRLKALGVERDVVILEVHGNVKDRGKIEQALPTELVEKVEPATTKTPGVARLMLINRTAQRKRKAEDRVKKAVEERKQNNP